MAQATAQPITLYDRDLDLWLETAIGQLKVGDFHIFGETANSHKSKFRKPPKSPNSGGL